MTKRNTEQQKLEDNESPSQGGHTLTLMWCRTSSVGGLPLRTSAVSRLSAVRRGVGVSIACSSTRHSAVAGDALRGLAPAHFPHS